ncbi:hypothetical protein QEZ54_24305 [Catellatospora sp. KI3]|uniref:hypothetical protein n=1 Tax=Catellatospora sp. KI3 TaxID=3041620 RepID=UPI002482B029|nr:hypothetical protein [Catellatospora sp. KI3]MDI1464114.1 hypothetical protein [Catellatospora sp. KI3]
MTSDLRDAFDDLSADVAPYVVGDDLGRTAWRAGRRRRTRRLAATGGLALAAAAVLALIAPWPVIPQTLGPAGTDARATGYPQRITHQWWLSDLPDRPGPLAGLVEINGPDTFGWRALSQHGNQWRLPQGIGTGDWPALSSDGRRLGYLAAQEGPYVLRDLVEGTQLRIPSISGGTIGLPARYWVGDQTPTFWSPDGAHLLLSGGERTADGTPPAGLIVDLTGSVRSVPGDLGFPAGWAAADRPVWVKVSGADGRSEYKVTATTTDLTGTPVTTVTLRPSDAWPGGGGLNQWSGLASPTGDQLLLTGYLTGDRGEVRRFSLRDGTELGVTTVDDVWVPCGSSWAGEVAAMPLMLRSDDGGTASTALLRPDGPRQVVAADPDLSATCLVWASDALAGEAHGWPFGLSTAWWSWWWREILAGAAALAMLLWGWIRLGFWRVPVRSKAAPPA